MTRRRSPWLLCAALWSLLCAAQAETHRLAGALLETQREIEDAAAELALLRETVAAERNPLAARLDSLQTETAELRAEMDRLRTLLAHGDRERAAAESAAEALAEECRFAAALLQEYRRSMETRAGAADAAFLEKRWPSMQERLRDEDDFARLPEALESLFTLSLEWNALRLGGYTFAGTALDAGGREHAGHFLVVGPTAYFVSREARMGGLVTARAGVTQPAVHETPGASVPDRILDVVREQTGVLPVDVTSGDALRLQAARPSLLAHARKGGAVMIPLLLVGLFAAALAAAKGLELFRFRADAPESLRRIAEEWKTGRPVAADRVRKQLPPPVASLVLACDRHRGAPRERVEEILHEQVLAIVPGLERHLGTLAVLGGVSPLLGLLGTVTGMIHTFQLVTVFGSGNARLLSGGISEALVTTQFGLAIAIPVLLVHAVLARRARSIVACLEQTALWLVNECTPEADTA